MYFAYQSDGLGQAVLPVSYSLGLAETLAYCIASF